MLLETKVHSCEKSNIIPFGYLDKPSKCMIKNFRGGRGGGWGGGSSERCLKWGGGGWGSLRDLSKIS